MLRFDDSPENKSAQLPGSVTDTECAALPHVNQARIQDRYFHRRRFSP